MEPNFSESSFPIHGEGIKKYVPHREPFLMIDSIESIEPYQRIVAWKNVSHEDPVFQGHFPSRPIFPGVLVLEGLAQASCFLGNYSSAYREAQGFKDRKPGLHLLSQICDAKFKGQVLPGSDLRYEVTIRKSKMGFTWFDGVAKVGNQKVVQAEISAFFQEL